MTSTWWIRRDLRLTDNAPLHSARRKDFLYEGLHALDKDLRERIHILSCAAANH